MIKSTRTHYDVMTGEINIIEVYSCENENGERIWVDIGQEPPEGFVVVDDSDSE